MTLAMNRQIDYSPLREWANGYTNAEGMDQHRRALVLSLLAENERLRQKAADMEAELSGDRTSAENQHHWKATAMRLMQERNG